VSVEPPASDVPWWREAVVYQIYPRSFADGNGDGTGDLAGLRSRLPYLADLGVDAVWLNPWYVSPLADGGYDVEDYRRINPEFGTLAEAEAFVAEAHEHGIRVLLDIVPNHLSEQHPWFRAALAAGPGSPERKRFWFRPGRGENGDEPPNNWRSIFGGGAWERVTEPDGTPGEWYLHLFGVEQPDVNWNHPDVAAEMEAVLRFWFDRGVDGFRVDVADLLVKEDGLPDDDKEIGYRPWKGQDGIHDIYRSWRTIADKYDPPRVFVAEAWVKPPELLARFVRSDELHTAFNFDFLTALWTPADLRHAVDTTTEALFTVGAPATWVLSNHDVVRHATRYGRSTDEQNSRMPDVPVDDALGLRRARAAALLSLALPGGAYIYQGDELGLPWVELPVEVLQCPHWVRSGFTRKGRDGCRVPIPWSGDRSPYGFGPDGSKPWLPMPAEWATLSVAAQDTDPDSHLNLYRTALRIRRGHPALGDGGFTWLDSPPQVLAFSREPGFVCLVNLGVDPVDLPPHDEVLLASGSLDDGRLPSDTTVWLASS